jgi:hypothetical protein
LGFFRNPKPGIEPTALFSTFGFGGSTVAITGAGGGVVSGLG